MLVLTPYPSPTGFRRGSGCTESDWRSPCCCGPEPCRTRARRRKSDTRRAAAHPRTCRPGYVRLLRIVELVRIGDQQRLDGRIVRCPCSSTRPSHSKVAGRSFVAGCFGSTTRTVNGCMLRMAHELPAQHRPEIRPLPLRARRRVDADEAAAARGCSAGKRRAARRSQRPRCCCWRRRAPRTASDWRR